MSGTSWHSCHLHDFGQGTSLANIVRCTPPGVLNSSSWQLQRRAGEEGARSVQKYVSTPDEACTDVAAASWSCLEAGKIPHLLCPSRQPQVELCAVPHAHRPLSKKQKLRRLEFCFG
jgi:hypothetical protein